MSSFQTNLNPLEKLSVIVFHEKSLHLFIDVKCRYYPQQKARLSGKY